LDEAARILLSPPTLGFMNKEGWRTRKEAEAYDRLQAAQAHLRFLPKRRLLALPRMLDLENA
jgi:hypothetical protein